MPSGTSLRQPQVVTTPDQGVRHARQRAGPAMRCAMCACFSYDSRSETTSLKRAQPAMMLYAQWDLQPQDKTSMHSEALLVTGASL